MKLLVHGKGRKERRIQAPPGTEAAIRAWLKFRGDEPGALIGPVLKNGRVVARQVSPRAIWEIVCRVQERAAVADFSPHDLRRTFVSMMLEKHDAGRVAGMVGHASTATTQRYDRRPERARDQAFADFDVPFEDEEGAEERREEAENKAKEGE